MYKWISQCLILMLPVSVYANAYDWLGIAEDSFQCIQLEESDIDGDIFVWLPERINFQINQFVIEESCVISDLAYLMLKSNIEINLSISGHTDAPGSEEYNHTLGMKRALDLVNRLSEAGVDRERMSFTSFGEKTPLVKSEGEEMLNRRIEILLYVQSQ